DKPSSSSARCSCCRSSSCTPAGPFGCSAARCGPKSAIIEGGSSGGHQDWSAGIARSVEPAPNGRMQCIFVHLRTALAAAEPGAAEDSSPQLAEAPWDCL